MVATKNIRRLKMKAYLGTYWGHLPSIAFWEDLFCLVMELFSHLM